MFDDDTARPPAALAGIQEATGAIGFDMFSDSRTGSLLRTLAATKPKGTLLELGTGTGISTAWLLDGMDSDSTLLTVDNDKKAVAVAQEHLGGDSRVGFILMDGASCLKELSADGRRFDLLFADTWPGKYTHLDEALRLVAVGGLYIVDDMQPQPNWPEDHPPKVAALIESLGAHPEFHITMLNWSTGILLAGRLQRTPTH